MAKWDIFRDSIVEQRKNARTYDIQWKNEYFSKGKYIPTASPKERRTSIMATVNKNRVYMKEKII